MRFWFCLLLLTAVFANSIPAAVPGIDVAAGYVLEEFCDTSMTPDVWAMTIDDQGRIYVSGRGYIRRLIDSDNDGKADRVEDVPNAPKVGAMGLWRDPDALFFVADGGLWRIPMRGDTAIGPVQRLLSLRAQSEHDAHAVRRGPDGWLYVLCGDNAGIDRLFPQLPLATADRPGSIGQPTRSPKSPIQKPIAGCLVRLDPTLTRVEIVADGFRNPYDFDFDAHGEPFVYDSDNERCVGLPWYEPTRLYHLRPGANHGWLFAQGSAKWRKAPYYCDVAEPVVTLGRGSPTGVAFDRFARPDAEQRPAFFLADWTFGRLDRVTLTRHGSTYRGTVQTILRSTGSNGFAPTALAFHPQRGELFLSIGGRGTRGGVYRLKPTTPSGPLLPPVRFQRQWADELDGPKPLPLPIDWSKRSAAERVTLLHHLLRWSERYPAAEIEAAIRVHGQTTDRPTRQVLVALLRRLPAPERRRLANLAQTPREHLLVAWADSEAPSAESWKHWWTAFLDPNCDDATRLEAFRVYHLLAGGLPAPPYVGKAVEGYRVARTRPQVEALHPFPPAEQWLPKSLLQPRRGPDGTMLPPLPAELRREWIRWLGILQFPLEQLPESLWAEFWQQSAVEQLHALIALTGMSGKLSGKRIDDLAQVLMPLPARYRQEQITTDRNWPIRVTEMLNLLPAKAAIFAAIVARVDPASASDAGKEWIPDILVSALNSASFPSSGSGKGEWEDGATPQRLRQQLAQRLWQLHQAGRGVTWTPTKIALLDELPASRVCPLLRQLWQTQREETAVLLLTQSPSTEDAPAYVEALASARPDVVRAAIAALQSLTWKPSDADQIALFRLLYRRTADREPKLVYPSALALLRKWNPNSPDSDDATVWLHWLQEKHPEWFARLGPADGVDVAAWRKRLAQLDWSRGDARRGQAVFQLARCSACHNAANAVGPDLTGVAQRFSREDLFTAIVQPSRDISPRYQATQIETKSGRIYLGMIVYDAPDGTLLQIDADTTVRIAGQEIESRSLSSISLMPTGLLDRLSDEQIVDLYSYLRSLGAPANASTK